MYRNCTLAVLNSGSHTDSSKELLDKYKSFDVSVTRRDRGIKLELSNPPEHAFVDGNIIKGIQEHLFSVLRDMVYVNMQIADHNRLNLTKATHLTNLVFSILRNAKALHTGIEPNLVVCWGVIQLTQSNISTLVKLVMNLAYVSSISVLVVVQEQWKVQ